MQEANEKIFFYTISKGKNKISILNNEKAETNILLKSYREYIRSNIRKNINEELFLKYRERYIKNKQVEKYVSPVIIKKEFEEKLYNRAKLLNDQEIEMKYNFEKNNFKSPMKIIKVDTQKYEIDSEVNYALYDQITSEKKKNDEEFRIYEKNQNRSLENRIININALINFIEKIYFAHSNECLLSLNLINEEKYGLSSIMTFCCNNCMKEFKFTTSDYNSKLQCYDINYRACYGSLISGNGYQDLTTIISCCAIPCMSKITFIDIENKIFPSIKNYAAKNFSKYAEEANKLAIERERFSNQGLPAIRIQSDCG